MLGENAVCMCVPCISMFGICVYMCICSVCLCGVCLCVYIAPATAAIPVALQAEPTEAYSWLGTLVSNVG